MEETITQREIDKKITDKFDSKWKGKYAATCCTCKNKCKQHAFVGIVACPQYEAKKK